MRNYLKNLNEKIKYFINQNNLIINFLKKNFEWILWGSFLIIFCSQITKSVILFSLCFLFFIFILIPLLVLSFVKKNVFLTLFNSIKKYRYWLVFLFFIVIITIANLEHKLVNSSLSSIQINQQINQNNTETLSNKTQESIQSVPNSTSQQNIDLNQNSPSIAQTPEPTTNLNQSSPSIGQTPKTTTNLNQSLPSIQTSNDVYYVVSEIIDGDTIIVNNDNQIHKIRIIGINTPETGGPNRKVECYGKEATENAKSLLLNKRVRLEADPSQGEYDKYNRLLRYVFLENGTDFGFTMIKEGFAYEYTYKTPYKYQQKYKQAQQEAQINKRGLWAQCL